MNFLKLQLNAAQTRIVQLDIKLSDSEKKASILRANLKAYEERDNVAVYGQPLSNVATRCSNPHVQYKNCHSCFCHAGAGPFPTQDMNFADSFDGLDKTLAMAVKDISSLKILMETIVTAIQLPHEKQASDDKCPMSESDASVEDMIEETEGLNGELDHLN